MCPSAVKLLMDLTRRVLRAVALATMSTLAPIRHTVSLTVLTLVSMPSVGVMERMTCH